jgi:hypothetical protein
MVVTTRRQYRRSTTAEFAAVVPTQHDEVATPTETMAPPAGTFAVCCLLFVL